MLKNSGKWKNDNIMFWQDRDLDQQSCEDR